MFWYFLKVYAAASKSNETYFHFEFNILKN